LDRDSSIRPDKRTKAAPIAACSCRSLATTPPISKYQKYTFGVVKAAQARGDLDVLAERDRRVLRIHLGPHVAAGLTSLKDAVRQALA